MSRLGQKPIGVPEAVEVAIDDQQVRIKGPKGRLVLDVHPAISVCFDVQERQLRLGRPSDSKSHKALHGLMRALLNNMVTGVTAGFEKRLRLIGIGCTARVQDEEMVLQVGFSHPVRVPIPEDIEVESTGPVAGETRIVVRGIDKQQVGQFAASLRRVKPPEPYKGKGIRYEDEVVRRKVGKAFVGGI